MYRMALDGIIQTTYDIIIFGFFIATICAIIHFCEIRVIEAPKSIYNCFWCSYNWRPCSDIPRNSRLPISYLKQTDKCGNFVKIYHLLCEKEKQLNINGKLRWENRKMRMRIIAYGNHCWFLNLLILTIWSSENVFATFWYPFRVFRRKKKCILLVVAA